MNFDGMVGQDIDFAAYLQATEAKANVHSAGAYADDLVAAMRADRTSVGDAMPWAKMSGKFQLRPRELTVWAGYKGHAKSAVISDAMLAQMAAGRTVGVISPEFPALEVLARKVRQSAATSQPPERYIRAWSAWANRRLFVFDKQSSLDPELVLGVVAYMIDRGCNHIVVDSLMKTGIRGHDGSLYEQQKTFVDRLQHLAHGSQDTHIHLVAHAKKPGGDDDRRPPTMYDVKGASELVDMAENVIVVWMDKRKQIDRESGRDVDESQPDVTLTVEAQRNFPRLGRFGLYFAKGLRFVGSPNQKPAPYFVHESEAIA